MEEGQPPAAGLSALGDVVRRTAYEEVLDRLRRAILGGEVEPGTPLILAELSTRLGVSRTPIREAIRDLAAEGLVDFDSYRSAVVHSPTLEEAQEVYDLRLVLEPLAVRRAVPKISDEDIARARELYERMLTTDELGVWVPLNRDFHAILMEPASSPRLLSIIESLRNAAATQVAMSIRVVPTQLTSGNEDHAQILAAYTRRDADAAVTMVERHLRSTIEAIESYERIRTSG
jgi:DNA-binding GntR family transcriptional regulator